MNQKKSSRKINILAAILILVVGVFIGGYLVLKSGRSSAGELSNILEGQSIDHSLCQPNVEDPTKDSDKDNLKDWQEIQIYHTDPCKQDTDGDGYLDGEEVASGYDPAKKAPGDELPGTTPKGPRPLPANLTQALGSILGQQIATGKIDSFNQQGQILSAAELEQYPAIQQSVQQIISAGNQLFEPEVIDEKQIKTTTDNSRAAIQAYAKKAHDGFSSLKEKDTSKIETQIFLDAMQSNNFSEMENQIQSYQEAYQNLKELTVPGDFLLLHTQVMNIFSSLIKTYQAIMEIESDPLKANLALQKYTVLLEQTLQWAKSFELAIKNHQ